MQGNCPTTFLDMFITSKCGTNGDSVSNDTTLYWKEGENLKFGTIEDLFLCYNNSVTKDNFYVLSGYRRKDAFGNKPKDKFSPKTIDIGFSRIYDVMYHGIKPVWRVELRNDKSIEVTEDHSLFGLDEIYSMGHFLTIKQIVA
jgi:intein/homing endonuclease